MRCLALIPLTLLALGACARPPEEVRAGEQAPLAPRASQRILVAPLDRRALPPALDAGLERLGEEIESHLRERGHDVTTLPAPLFDSAWSTSARAAGGLLRDPRSDPERYRAVVAQTLARLAHRLGPFDALVLPQLVLRPVGFRGADVRFDGVVRRLRLANVPRDTIVSHLSGETTALSLGVEIYSADGRRLLASRGGLDLAMKIDLATDRSALRADALADREARREGIRIAFAPYLGPAPD